ncbi:heavy metal-binding domain-containing protein [Bacillus cereus]|nr:heavy metal-binding domain-containing protein [Bacillus cereus]
MTVGFTSKCWQESIAIRLKFYNAPRTKKDAERHPSETNQISEQHREAESSERKLKEARDIAMKEMKQLAKQKGANAIVGIDVNYEVVRDGILMVAVSGIVV